MPSFSNFHQHIEPDDLATLQELFDAVCEQEHIARHSAVADEIARRVMLLYQSGVRDRGVYLALIRAGKRRDMFECAPLYHRGRVH